MKASLHILAAVVALAAGCAAGPVDEPAGEGQALIVACTTYDHLEGCDLVGPANDAVLFAQVLRERFDFAPEQIVTLCEAAGEAGLRPTGDNIVRELERLARTASAGGQVVILLSGHGTQQPDQAEPDPDDPEPDGLDEVFLPCDVGMPESDGESLANGLVDDDLRRHMREITGTGASLWVIVDSCHSGTMLRGPANETVRQVPASELFSESVLAAARQRAARQRAARAADFAGELDSYAQRLAVVYAGQSYEPTVEVPIDADENGETTSKTYGLLTYHICRVLAESRPDAPFTYAELVQRVNRLYAGLGRSFPTPAVEGLDRDREVLGLHAWPERSRLLLARDARGNWSIPAGALHGLTVNSRLAVFAPDAPQGADEPAGYAVVRELQPLSARVRACDAQGEPVEDELPDGGRCELVYFDYGPLRLTFAVEADAARRDASSGRAEAAKNALAEVAARADAPILVVDDPAAADWRVQVNADGLYLVPSQGVVLREDLPASPIFGPFRDDELSTGLADVARRIARVGMLKQLAGTEGAPSDSGLKLAVDVIRYRDGTDREGEVISAAAAEPLREGSEIAFRLENRGSRTVFYPTLLYIDSAYGVTAIYPGPGEVVEPMRPASAIVTQRLVVNAKTIGSECAVAIAILADGPPVDFVSLEQASLPQARDAARLRAGNDDIFDSNPLGRLLANALYAQGAARGVSPHEMDSYAMQLVPLRVEPLE
jgi:hypothetical protein